MSLGAVALRGASRQKIVEDVPRPFRQPHRGIGGNAGMDDALSSLDRLMRIAPAFYGWDGLDMSTTSDGVAVVMHDDTVDRTTDGTGAVSSMTLAQFKALHLLNYPYVAGQTASTEAPPTFDEFLNYATKYRAAITPEAKDTASATRIINAIKAKGLERSTIAGSFDINSVRTFKAAGLKTYLPQSQGNHLTSAALLADAANIDYLAYEWNAAALDDTYLSPLFAAGMKPWPFTILRRTDEASAVARLAAMSGGPFFMEAISSDDPLYASGLWSPSTTYVPTTDNIEPGMIEAPFGGTRPRPLGGWLAFASASTSGHWLLMGNMARAVAPAAVDVTFRVDTPSATTSRWFGLKLHATDDRALATNSTGANANVGVGHYSAILRSSGSLELYTIFADGTSAQISTSAATPALVAGDQGRLRFEVAGSTVTLKRLALDGTVLGTVTGTNSSWRGGYFHIGKSFGTDGMVSFGTITVTP